MDRRWVFLAILFLWIAPAAAAPTNVVVIFADDLGYGDLSSYGHPAFKTPHLDRMAAQGARFTDFYVPVPFCAPSRGSLLTGRYPFRHRVVMNPFPTVGINDVGIPAEEVTLGEAFQSGGYATGHIGKWHLGHKPEFYPTRNGFDEFYGILYSNDMRPVQLLDGETVVEYPVVQATLTTRYTERAVSFIEKHRERPFFLYVAHAMPHKPLAVSERFWKKSGAGLYGDVIAELDWSTGEIVAKLQELGLEKNTLVIFTSDNGPWYGGSTGGLRGMKNTCWEGGIRVPMIAYWPGTIPPGQTRREPTSLMDIYPTVLAACGLALPDRQLDGKSLLALLKGEQTGSPHEGVIAMRGGTELKTIRSGRWKLHLTPPINFKRGPDFVDPWAPDGIQVLAPHNQPLTDQPPGLEGGCTPEDLMLFDLDTDPGEQRNLAAEHPEIVARLRDQIEAFRRANYLGR